MPWETSIGFALKYPSLDAAGAIYTGIWVSKGLTSELSAQERPVEFYDVLPWRPGVDRKRRHDALAIARLNFQK
ncbi:hypothetical protein KSC_108720 [Ktedonobacter sp. SOSP1-52]|nr:hypothetical protein KSC_108720 [Ktedonobacter sp. SOSP1-52]